MAVSLVFLLAVICLSGSVRAEDCPDQKDDLSDDLNCLTHCVTDMDRKLTAEWEEETRIRPMVELRDRVRDLEGSGCRDFYEFQCGGTQPQCVAYYLVCDGAVDCPNGADEDNCVDLSTLFSKGSIWFADVFYDTCSVHHNEDWDCEVTSYEESPYFPGKPIIQWNWNATQQLPDSTNVVYVPTEYSYYNHAERVLVFRFKQINNNIYYCYFDGVNYDSCHFYTHRGDDPVPCAEFTLRRVSTGGE